MYGDLSTSPKGKVASPSSKQLELLSDCSSLSSEGDHDQKAETVCSTVSNPFQLTRNSSGSTVDSEIVFTESLGATSRKYTLQQLNKRDRGGRTLLFKYIARGNLETVRCISQAGGDLTVVDYAGYSLLHLASLEGHLDLVKFLVQRGANVNLQASNGDTPLHDAVENERTDVVLFLLRSGADPLLKNKSNESSLENAPSSALQRQLAEWVEWTQKACVSDPDTQETLLHKACKTSDASLVSKCLSFGASVHDRDATGKTPLHDCSAVGALECVKILLTYGAETDAPGPNQETPLYFAARDGHISVARALLEYGADPRRTNGDCQSALNVCSDPKMLALLEQPPQTFQPLKQPKFKALQVSPTGLTASTSLFDSAQASKAIDNLVYEINAKQRRDPADTQLSSRLTSKRPSMSSAESDSLSAPRHEHYWGGIETLGGALSAREMRKLPSLMKRFESMSSLSSASQKQAEAGVRSASSDMPTRKRPNRTEAGELRDTRANTQSRPSRRIQSETDGGRASKKEQTHAVPTQRGRRRRRFSNDSSDTTSNESQLFPADLPTTPSFSKKIRPVSVSKQGAAKDVSARDALGSPNDASVLELQQIYEKSDEPEDVKGKNCQEESSFKEKRVKIESLSSSGSPGRERDAHKRKTPSPEDRLSKKPIQIKRENSCEGKRDADDLQTRGPLRSNLFSQKATVTKKPPVLIPLRRKSHLPRNPMIGISGYQKLGQRSPMLSSSSSSMTSMSSEPGDSPKAGVHTESSATFGEFKEPPVELAESIAKHRRKNCLPLCAFSLEEAPSKNWFVDFQVGLALGLKSGRELLERHPKLKRRVATSLEKLTLEQCQLASLILDSCTEQGRKWIQKTADNARYRLSMLDLHFVDAEEVLQLLTRHFFPNSEAIFGKGRGGIGGLANASQYLNDTLSSDPIKWAMFDLESLTRSQYPIYTVALNGVFEKSSAHTPGGNPTLEVPQSQPRSSVESVQNQNQNPDSNSDSKISASQPAMSSAPTTSYSVLPNSPAVSASISSNLTPRVATTNESHQHIVIPKKFAVRSWKHQ